MNNKKKLVNILFGGISLFSGCSSMSLLPVQKQGGIEPMDMRNSMYAPAIRQKAEELAKSRNIDDEADAVKGYGYVGELEKMDEIIKRIIQENLDRGLTYAEIGDRFHKFYK